MDLSPNLFLGVNAMILCHAYKSNFAKILHRYSNSLLIKDFRTNEVLSSFHTQNSYKKGKYSFTNLLDHAGGVCLFTFFHSQVI